MTGFKSFHLKHDMNGANFVANFIGVFFVMLLSKKTGVPLPESLFQNPVIDWIDSIFIPFAFVFVPGMTLLYERPIRRYLKAKFDHEPIPPNLENEARRKILNEPFVLMALDFSMWLLSAIIYPLLLWMANADPYMIQRSLFNSLSIGLITVTIAFFLLEHILQKRLVPYFFPNGGLYTIPRTLRIRIRTRLAALLLACNLIPLFSILQLIQRSTGSPQSLTTSLEQLRSAIFLYTAIFAGFGIFLTMLVSRNLTLPFSEIIQTLRNVRNGRFDKKVKVTSNDEIGYTGDIINEMTDGLKERDHMRHSLNLAMEVQQHLMPATNPQIPGLDVAGTSIYCEETGGDYYDYLPGGENDRGKLGVVVGDVSDHGIPAALLMTTARAFLRQRWSRPGDLDQIVADINRQLSRDVKESGRFMTLFFGEIDCGHATLNWVNAGHEPAVIYDPNTRMFTELSGGGLPLGVSEGAVYQKNQSKIGPGQIILIGTDGVWELQDAKGRMFGKDRFREVIRIHAGQPAQDILKAVIAKLEDFCRPAPKTDDVTLVVVKVEK
jgi:serine phosphatase RsbU (regulator of sigma subunit)